MSAVSTKKKSKIVLRAGIWYTVSSFMTKGIAFITTPIFTRLLSSEDYGKYNNFVAWIGIIAIVATMDMHATVNRARFDYENLDAYLSSVAITGSIFTAFLWAIVLVFSDFFCDLFSMNMTCINIMFITTLVSPSLTLLQAKNRINYKYKAYVMLSLGSVVLSVVVSLLLVVLAENQLMGRIIGHYGTVFIIDLCVYIYIIVKGKNFKWSECTYALKICLPMIPHLLSKYILNQSDRIMIEKFCGSSDTAYYSLSYNCAMIPIMLATATNIAWSPWSTEQIYKKNYEKVKKAAYYYITLFFLVILGIFLLGPEIVLILGGKKYASATSIMPPVVLGAAFQFIYNLYVALEQFAKKTVGMAIGTVFAALINVGLNWLLIPKFGYVAAAYTTLIGYACLLVIHFFLARRIGYAKAYNNKFIFISVFVLFVIMLIMLWLYSQTAVIRYIIIVVGIVSLSVVSFLNKKTILSLLKK